MSRFRMAIDRFDIVRWADQHVELQDKGGKNVYGRCMVCHSDKKLSISRDKKIVRCFACDDGGKGGNIWNGRADLIRFIMLVLKCNRARAIQELFDKAGPLPVEAKEVDLLDLALPDESMLIGHACDENHPCMQYLVRRGMQRFANQWYMCPTGRYSGRIIIPCLSFGEDWGFEAKSYCGGDPKSLTNLREGALWVTQAWDAERPYAVITEAVFDAEAIGMNAVGMFGSALDENRLTELLRLRSRGVTRLIWMLDDDAFGKQLKIIRKWVSLYFENYRVKFPPHLKGQDPSSLSFLDRWSLIQAAEPVETVWDYVTDLMEAA